MLGLPRFVVQPTEIRIRLDDDEQLFAVVVTQINRGVGGNNRRVPSSWTALFAPSLLKHQGRQSHPRLRLVTVLQKQPIGLRRRPLNVAEVTQHRGDAETVLQASELKVLDWLVELRQQLGRSVLPDEYLDLQQPGRRILRLLRQKVFDRRFGA